MKTFIKAKSPICKFIYNLNRHFFNRCKKRKVDYAAYVEYTSKLPTPNYRLYPCVTPMWDNTSRRIQKMFILSDSTPEKYGNWLSSVMRKFKPFSEQENFVFINAWNEWAEGNHLEPDAKWGSQYLEETKKAVEN